MELGKVLQCLQCFTGLRYDGNVKLVYNVFIFYGVICSKVER